MFNNLEILNSINSEIAKQISIDDSKDSYIKKLTKSINLRYENGKIRINQMIAHYTSKTCSKNRNNCEEIILKGFICLINSNDENKFHDSISFFTQAIETNNLIALDIIIVLLFNFDLFDKDIKIIIYYLEILADQNNVSAQIVLGSIYYKYNTFNENILENGAINEISIILKINYLDLQKILLRFEKIKGIKTDQIKAKNYLIKASNQNSPIAQTLLGIIYLDEKNNEKGFDYLYKASKNDFYIAQLLLGLIFLEDEWYNLDDAICYLDMAANNNDIYSQLILGFLFIDNKNDIDKGIHYFQMAADNGNSLAQCYVGYFNINTNFNQYNIIIPCNYGNELTKNKLFKDFDINKFYSHFYNNNITCNIQKGIQYLTLSAKQNNTLAQIILGINYLINKRIVSDINKGIYFLSLAADQNEGSAQAVLGLFYYNGIYVEQDKSKGENLLKLAADQNNNVAQYYLGLLHIENNHIETSIKYLTLSANQHNPYAQYELGKIFQYKNDKKKAFYYFLMAANNNLPDAQYKIGTYYINMNEYTFGLDFLIKSAENQYYHAYFSLGILYHLAGEIPKAIHYYKEASSLNDQFSKNNLAIIYKYGFGGTYEKNIAYSIELLKESNKKMIDWQCII